VAFDAHPTVVSLLVEDRKAMAEFEFRGTHIAEFAGQAASGKEVSLPYSVGYDVDGDKITALRAYMSLDGLIKQISMSPDAAQAVA
jgi:predicted ester cyclase